ncbi:hypothetical protein PINS_up007875 [Pythium insidiosum]|nr:hypothetical protein PINS_up007875 [Pythium insidiosum]
MELQREYLRNARRKARQSRGYFDGDDDDDDAIATLGLSGDEDEREHEANARPPRAPVGDVDPLDAFMAGIDAQVTQQQQRSTAASAHAPPPREKVASRCGTWLMEGHG